MWKALHQLAIPERLYRLCGCWIPWLAALSALLLVIGLGWGFGFAPADYQQGESYRIMYLHVPAAMWSMGLYLAMAVAAFVGVVWQIKMSDLAIAALAPVGAVCTLVALVSGAAWGKPMWGTWWIWDAEKGTYVNTNISCELTGPTGNGIQSIQLTQGNHMPGSTDIYTVTMTDGSKYNIAVYNGLNGTGTGDVLGIHFDLVLPASGWSNGSITVAESRLVAAAKYKYLIDAYEASREEYLECNVRPKDISTTGFITFVNDTDPIKDITVNIVRLELSVNAEEGGE